MLYSYSFKGQIYSLNYTNPQKFYSGAITAQFCVKICIYIYMQPETLQTKMTKRKKFKDLPESA